MDLQRLRYFVAVGRELHFTRAAQGLYLDQGALSSSIRRLERDLGVRLFERTSRRVALTDAGAALMGEAQRVLSAADRFTAVAQRARAADRHVVRVGRLYAPGAAYGPILRELRRTAPEVGVEQVDLGVDAPTVALRTGAVDAVFVVWNGRGWDGEEVQTTPLWVDRATVLVAPWHEIADADELPVAEVVDRTFRPPLPGEPLAWYREQTLHRLRGEDPRTLRTWRPMPEPLRMAEQAMATDVLLPSSGTISSEYPLARIGLRSIPVVDGPPVGVSLLTRPGDDREDVHALRRAARLVAADVGRVIPGARPA